MARTQLTIYQNLIIRSEAFDADWTKDGVTVSANTVETLDPIGGNTADKLLETAVDNNHRVYLAPTTALIRVTASVYAKAAERTWVQINTSDGFSTFFDIGNGALGTEVGGGSATIESAGNGWYRCSLTYTRNGLSNNVLFQVASANGTISYPGDITKGIYLWGAQVVEANWAGPYIQTTTTIVNTGNIRNKTTGRSQTTTRTQSTIYQNLLLRSEEIDHAAWTKQTDVLITANQATAPDGTLTADLVDVTAAAGNTGFFQVATPGSLGRQNTKSIYLKGLLGTEVVGLVDPAASVGVTTCNLTTAWQRFTLTEAAGSQPNTCGLWVRKSSGNQFYAWGAQIVLANWAGPYQVTTSSAVNIGSIRNQI